jgi:hypothetical protein
MVLWIIRKDLMRDLISQLRILISHGVIRCRWGPGSIGNERVSKGVSIA